MEESLRELITQRVAEVLKGGATCVVNIQATIAALEVAGEGSPMVDITLVARVDDRVTGRRIAVHSGDDDALWGVLSDTTSALVDDHLAVVSANAKARAADAAVLAASQAVAAQAVASPEV